MYYTDRKKWHLRVFYYQVLPTLEKPMNLLAFLAFTAICEGVISGLHGTRVNLSALGQFQERWINKLKSILPVRDQSRFLYTVDKANNTIPITNSTASNVSDIFILIADSSSEYPTLGMYGRVDPDHVGPTEAPEPISPRVLAPDESVQIPLFTYPSKCSGIWKEIAPKDLLCPLHIQPPIHHKQEVQITVIPNRVTAEVTHLPGFICHKMKYVVNCETGFFGQQSVTKEIHEVKISSSECAPLKGTTSDAPYFPARLCAWMKMKVSEQEFIIVSDHQVEVDLYSLELIDPLFPQGKCKASPCSTIHASSVWLQHESPTQVCPIEETIPAVYYTSKIGDRPLSVIAPGRHPFGLTHACRIKFCNRWGLAVDLGSWVSIAGFQGQFPTCPRGTLLQMRGHTDDFAYLGDLIYKTGMRTTCLNTLDIIKETHTVSPLQLSHFRQPHEGEGYAYRHHDGILQRDICTYTAIQKFGTPKEQFGFAKAGDKISYRFTEKGQGINGMLLKDDAVIIPDQELLQVHYDLIVTEELPITPMKHPMIEVWSNTTEDASIVLHPQSEGASVKTLVDKIKDNLASLITTGLLIFGIIGSVCFIGMYCLKRRKRERVTSDEPTELQSMFQRSNR